MGDMADYYLDHFYAFDWEDEGNEEPPERKAVTCNRCGETGFHWKKTEAGWRLFQQVGAMEIRHECKTCRQCGMTGLHWEQTPQGWRLFDGEAMHSCKLKHEQG